MEFEQSEPSQPAPESLVLHYPLAPVWVTYVLLALNILIFIPTWLLGDELPSAGGLIPEAVIGKWQLWRLVTAGFLHGGPTHLLFNMYALYILGQDTEKLFGSGRFLCVYLSALIGGNLVVTLLSPLDRTTIGASGAILGLLGALVAYFWQYRDHVAGARAHLTNLVTTALINVGLGLLPSISLWGHLGGVLAGLLAGWGLLPRYRVDYEPSPRLLRLPFGPPEVMGIGRVVVGCLVLWGLALWLRG